MEVHELADGGQGAETVAGWVAGFLGGARETLDLALYDIRLPGAPGIWWRAHCGRRGARGQVRLLYNADHEAPSRDSPPPSTKPELIELPFKTAACPGSRT